ncbi:hypothetical protein PVAND_015245 [Polypedilum vanderplanki]|uniref:Uncharacterized protein n=1 Tax=Polypedilum vanderplanki TaxID=319348 RepID=A0A9J6BCH0_POLVA|nr:hypothetical protein PVAND_015245 [Polypedilum vanderplanki]
MKDAKSLLNLLFAIVAFVKVEANKSHEEKPEFECANKFYHYYLDDEPAEYGLSAGQYAPDKRAYVAIGIWEGMCLVGGCIQLNPPGFYKPTLGDKGIFVNESQQMWYLGKRKHHHFQWIASENGKVEPFTIEFGLKSGGLLSYVGRIRINNFTFLGNVVPDMNIFHYVDENGNARRTNVGYEVLTCKSTKNETTIPPPIISSSNNLPNIDLPPECINNWQSYNYDDAPAKNGVIAEEYDCGNTAYVGKGSPSFFTRAGRLQIVVVNPNYTYRWENYDILQPPPHNAVLVRISTTNVVTGIARVQTNEHIKIGFLAPPIAYFPAYDGESDEMHYNFEILVCDPWPKYKCAQQWRKLNANISVDGFSVDSTSFIGRGRRKCINGCDYGLGKIQSGSNGVNYLDDLTATAVFDNSSNVEYLVKNPSDTYKWQPSRNGVKVVNALELHKEDHRPFYIGMTRIDDNVVIGKVRSGDGLFFIDPVTGKQQSTSSYEVLTCTSPDASNGEYEEESDADWFGSFGCPVRKEWSFIKWRCVCRDEFRGIFAASGAKWNDETCSYV